MQCLLLITQDKREYFLLKKDYHSITEYAKKFKAEVNIVDVHKPKIHNLSNLAKSLCNPEYKNQIIQYKVVKAKIGKQDKAKDYIFNQLISEKSFEIAPMLNKFKEYKRSTIYNYLCEVKKDLQNKGYKIKKIGNKYKLNEKI